MKILVIGGAGYIGSHVVLALMAEKYNVSVYDNMSSGQKENLFPENQFILGDILDEDKLIKVMKEGFDCIIHLAAFKAAGESMIKPEKYSVNNITGTLNILNAASVTGIQNIVFSSSAAVYGSPQYLPIDEKHPTIPDNYYGYTKLSIEGFLDWYDKLKDIKFAALRYFNAAGYNTEGKITGLEQNPANLLPVIMEVSAGIREKLQIFGNDYDTRDGSGIRDYIHVTDLAKAHVMALKYIINNKKSLTVNLGSDKGVSVLEMLESARKISGKDIPSEIVGRRAGDPATLYATSKNALEILNWKAEFSDVETLIQSTWEIYKQKYQC